MHFPPVQFDWIAAVPMMLLSVGGLGVLLVDAKGQGRNALVSAGAAAAVLAATLLWLAHPLAPHATAADARSFTGMLAVDGLGVFVTVICILTGLGTLALAPSYMAREGVKAGEIYPLVVFAVAGMSVLAMGTDLMVLFLGLEIMSLAVYVLAGYQRTIEGSVEAALKYFLLGAFASAIFLYGIAFMYGAAGSVRLDQVARALASDNPNTARLAQIGLGLLLAGLGFKIAAVPFHLWTPDVYQGAPTPVTAFMSSAVKAAAFALALRILRVGFGAHPMLWTEAVKWLAIATMVVGNLAALVQRDLKRMLAYSSIAHAGYLLAGVAAGHPAGTSAVLFYLAAYLAGNLGAFAVLVAIGEKGDRNLTLDDIAGLYKTHPGLAFALSACLLSLAGIPPTAGFFGKFLVFNAAVKAHMIGPAVLIALTSALSLGYYLTVIVKMYMAEPVREYATEPTSTGVRLVVVASVASVFVLGILPSLVQGFAEQAAIPLP